MALHESFGKNLKNISISPAFVKDVDYEDLLPCAMNVNEQFDFFKRLSKEHNLTYGTFYPSYFRQECAVRNPLSIVIGPDGELYKCWNDVAQKDKVYGHISGKILNESLLYEYLTGADPFDDPVCIKCKLLPVCAGGCPYTRLIDKNKGTRNACPLIASKIEDYLWEHYKSKKA